MKNTYNKGKYRGYEYGKISKFLQQKGNRRWRRTMEDAINEQLFDDNLVRRRTSLHRSRLPRSIALKITSKTFRDRTYSYYAKYRLARDAKNSLNRNQVIRATLVDTDRFSDHSIIPKDKR